MLGNQLKYAIFPLACGKKLDSRYRTLKHTQVYVWLCMWARSHTWQLVATRTCACYPLSIRLADTVASSARLQEFTRFSFFIFATLFFGFTFYAALSVLWFCGIAKLCAVNICSQMLLVCACMRGTNALGGGNEVFYFNTKKFWNFLT